MVISDWVLLRMRNAWNKFVKKHKTHILFSVNPPPRNMAKPDMATDDNIIRSMRILCWITKATDTHSEYVIIIAFPLWKWLSERVSLLFLNIHTVATNNICLGRNVFGNYSLLWARTACWWHVAMKTSAPLSIHTVLFPCNPLWPMSTRLKHLSLANIVTCCSVPIIRVKRIAR